MTVYQHVCVLIFIFCRARTQCPDNCECKVPDIECYNVLPSFIPEKITRVRAHQVPLQPVMNFTTPGWQTVTDLLLTLGNKREFLPIRRLQHYEFTGLVSLEKLQVMCNCDLRINDRAFHGLANVTVLDLSNNTGVYYSWYNDIVPALQGEDVLPHISQLYLSNMTGRYTKDANYLNLYSLHNAMINKPLQVLDLSSTNTGFTIYQYPPPPSILPQLQTLNVSRAGPAVFSLPKVYRYYKQTPEVVFTNLQVLDASYPYFPLTEAECLSSALHYWQFCMNGQRDPNFLPYNLTELYVKNMFRSVIHEFRGTYNSTHLCITDMFFSHNRTICIGSRFNRLQKLDISENSLTYIQPDLLHPFEALNYLDVSRNKLGQALTDENYANSLFQALQNLQALIISDNNITTIPNKALRHNRNLRTFDISHNNLISVDFSVQYLVSLEYLDLSYNNIVSVDFGLQYLVSLEYLDLSYNNIVSLDSVNCKILKNLHFSQNSLHSSKGPYEISTGLKLEGNPLSCSCDNLCLLKFIVDQDLNGTYTCSVKDKTEVVNFVSVKELEYSCKEWIVNAVFITLAVITVILSSVQAIVLIRERRRKKRKLNDEMQERLIARGKERYAKNENKFAAFISYSRDDANTVLPNIFPKLDKGLQEILGVQSRCVSTGDHDMTAGRLIPEEIFSCVGSSSVVIFFVTKSFCSQLWCRFEVTTACEFNKPVILMMHEDVDIEDMPPILKRLYNTYTRVHWMKVGDEYVMMPGWDSLCRGIVSLIGTEQIPGPEQAPEPEHDSEPESEHETDGQSHVQIQAQCHVQAEADHESEPEHETDSEPEHEPDYEHEHEAEVEHEFAFEYEPGLENAPVHGPKHKHKCETEHEPEHESEHGHEPELEYEPEHGRRSEPEHVPEHVSANE